MSFLSQYTDLHHLLTFARKHTFQTAGRAWQRLIASLVFETKVALSLVQEFDEQDQARFITIMNAFMSKELRVEEISAAYLEKFPHPMDAIVCAQLYQSVPGPISFV